MRSREDVGRVASLAARGLGASRIAALTGIPRGTVRHWLDGELPRHAQADVCGRCGGEHDPAGAPGAYAYTFGMYLGDGCLLRHPRGVWRLEITLDSIYPGIIDE